MYSCVIIVLSFPEVSAEENLNEDTTSEREDPVSGHVERTATQGQPDVPPSASKKRSVPEPISPQAPANAEQVVSKRIREELQASPPHQEAPNVSTLLFPLCLFFIVLHCYLIG